MRTGLLLAAAGVAVLLSAQPQAHSPAPPQRLSANDAHHAHGMLTDAYEAVKKQYYDPTFHGLDWDARYREYDAKVAAAPTVTAAITLVAAFLDGLHDSHTYFLPPDRTERAEYGYALTMIGDRSFVTHVTEGSDAARQLRVGDEVAAVNDAAVTRETFATMQYILQVLAPQRVTRLRVQDLNGAPRDVTVASKVTKARAVRNLSGAGAGAGSDLNDFLREIADADRARQSKSVVLGDVMVWRLPTFFGEDGDIDRAIDQARKRSTLILDLRDNAGGAVDTLRRLASNLFDRDVTLAERVTRSGRAPVVAKTRGKNAFTGKLLVLINSASASSAEILARVVQLEGRGTVMGDRSAGAVMESQILPYAQGDSLMFFYGFSVTDADLLMKDGKSLERGGVAPDELLLPTAADLAAGRDPVLARAAALAGVALDPVAASKLFSGSVP